MPGSRTLEMQAHMLSSSSVARGYFFMCWIQLSQMEYSAAKCASRSIAAGSQGISLSSVARTGSLNVLKAHSTAHKSLCCTWQVHEFPMHFSYKP